MTKQVSKFNPKPGRVAYKVIVAGSVVAELHNVNTSSKSGVQVKGWDVIKGGKKVAFVSHRDGFDAAVNAA